MTWIFSQLINEYYLTKKLIRKDIIGRKENLHKGDFWKNIDFWKQKFSGAAVIAADSCIRTGAGLTTLMTYDNTFHGNISSLPETMLLTLNNKNIEENHQKIERRCTWLRCYRNRSWNREIYEFAKYNEKTIT